MKTNQQKSKIGLLLVAFTLITLGAVAQETYKQVGSSKLTIAGTSTMHDWTMTTSEASYATVFEVNDQGNPIGLSSLVVTIAAESLKSGKGAMDKNAYTALKTDKYKQITFQLSSAKMDGKTIKCAGKLTIAGTTRPIDLEAVYTVNADRSIQVKGSKEIDMTTFNVEPPSFMFGSVKTGNNVTISFDVTFVSKNAQPITLN